MKVNEYLLFNVSWKETNPNLSDICKFFFMLPQAMNNSDIFQIYVKDQIKPYTLFGMICYWSGHYVCFFQSPEKEAGKLFWVYHEDRTITKLKNFKDLIVLCLKNHYHPVMLFYRQSESRISFYEDNTSLNERDFINMYRHCQRVDQANNLVIETEDEQGHLKEKPPESPTKVRPEIDVKRSNDVNLVKSITNLQKIEEMKKSGENVIEFYNFMDTMEAEKKENEEVKSPIQKGKRGSNFLGLRPGEWQCKNGFCGNVNNCSTYQCIKCRAINLKMYEAILLNKQLKGTPKINIESKAEKYEKLNKYYSSLNINYSKTGKKSEQPTEQDNVITMNLIQSSTNDQNKKTQFIESFEKEDTITDEKFWKCPFCKYQNEDDKGGFCEKCKRNKPKLNETKIYNFGVASTQKEIPMINGIKHYI